MKKGKAERENCGCEDLPVIECEMTCVEMNSKSNAVAVESDYKQAVSPGCECTPADPSLQCHAKFGGFWEFDTDGTTKCIPEAD